MTENAHVVRSAEQLRALLGEPRLAQQTKAIDRFDDHCRRWIAACPFVVIGSADSNGRMDLSPKGDPAGFVKVLDDATLAIPDRPGNKRFDTFTNVLANPNVALIFLVPGRQETLRVEGTATIRTDPDLLDSLSHEGRPPKLALVVTLVEVMFHCGKSMMRSKLWQPDDWPSIDGLSSYAECLADMATLDETLEGMEARFATWPSGNELY